MERPHKATAIAAGAVLALAGFVAIGPGTPRLGAEESGWLLPNLLAAHWGAPAEPVVTPRQAVKRHLVRHVPRDAAHGLRHQAGVSGRSICVRVCDGYFFPVAAYRGTSDIAAHEAVCRSTFPNTETRLFLMPGKSENVGEATAIHDGTRYASLPAAFRYTSGLSQACPSSLQQASRKPLSPLQDMTLRRGDLVMTDKGFQVFHGAEAFPYNRKDFVALAQSPDIQSRDRNSLLALEQASVPRSRSATKVAALPDVVDGRKHRHRARKPATQRIAKTQIIPMRAAPREEHAERLFTRPALSMTTARASGLLGYAPLDQ